MTIYIDGDSCHKEARQIIIKRANKEGISLWILADRSLAIDLSEYVHFDLIPSGEDAVDQAILDRITQEDLVVTRDIPLAKKVLEKDVQVMNDRGVVFSEEFIKERLDQRNWTLQLKEAGLHTPGGKNYNQKNKQEFANSFDKMIINLTK
ncbi:YaiI/YqxD family protein [Spirochaeta cellobiosiphila]|uniref:YaiI/YqxD family protein n=1 Tax=Spirochaeta cellobiosiphila TaxID=504483 RepID=UPI00146D0DFA|nr:DUF188 domain-containing protein [Spirochaeta cellobiosiphila]